MKLQQLKSPDATICLLEAGDGILADGFANGRVSPDLPDEDFTIVTLTAGPHRHLNDVEIYIPKSLVKQFRAAIGDAESSTVLQAVSSDRTQS